MKWPTLQVVTAQQYEPIEVFTGLRRPVLFILRRSDHGGWIYRYQRTAEARAGRAPLTTGATDTRQRVLQSKHGSPVPEAAERDRLSRWSKSARWRCRQTLQKPRPEAEPWAGLLRFQSCDGYAEVCDRRSFRND